MSAKIQRRRFLFPRLVAGLFVVACVLGLPTQLRAEPKMKVGFIFTGPISDFGWNASQNEGRKTLEKNCPWIETSYVESVADGDVESYIDQMADQGAKVIFVTSATFTDGTIEDAPRHPDVLFFDASGYKQAANVGTYVADTYQCSYLQGMAAGGLSKTGKIGCIASYPAPQGVRAMDAFALGLRSVNPKAVLDVRWLNSWYDPAAAKEAAEVLLAQGADVLINGMDSPTVLEVAEDHHVPVAGGGVDDGNVAPNTLIASSVYDWDESYKNLMQRVHDGVLTSHNLQGFDEWWRLSSHAVKLSYKPGVILNPKYKPALSAVMVDDGAGHKLPLYDLILQRYAQMQAEPPQFEPFTGPLTDTEGKLRVPAAQTATKAQLFTITWRLPGVIGSWPTN
jgi:simple sugar transport system substrate-binding protein